MEYGRLLNSTVRVRSGFPIIAVSCPVPYGEVGHEMG